MIDLQVPRFKQPDKSLCVPTSISMVFYYHGVRTSLYDIRDGIKEYDFSTGTSMRSAANFVRKQGFGARVTRSLLLSDLVELLKQDLPPIASMTDIRGIPHVVVIRGDTGSDLLINDPQDLRRRKMAYGDFSQRWHEQDYETLIIYDTVLGYSISSR